MTQLLKRRRNPQRRILLRNGRKKPVPSDNTDRTGGRHTPPVPGKRNQHGIYRSQTQRKCSHGQNTDSGSLKSPQEQVRKQAGAVISGHHIQIHTHKRRNYSQSGHDYIIFHGHKLQTTPDEDTRSSRRNIADKGLPSFCLSLLHNIPSGSQQSRCAKSKKQTQHPDINSSAYGHAGPAEKEKKSPEGGSTKARHSPPRPANPMHSPLPQFIHSFAPPLHYVISIISIYVLYHEPRFPRHYIASGYINSLFISSLTGKSPDDTIYPSTSR